MRCRTAAIRGLRVAALIVAAVALPCCSGDLGEGDHFRILTFRASETASGLQANGPSGGGSFSEDGRFFAFQSAASNLTDNDANGVTDILVKDRLTGVIENITNIDVAGTPLFLGDCSEPSLSADGRYVGFISNGIYKDISYPVATTPVLRPWRYDRQLKTFTGVWTYGWTPPTFLSTTTFGISLSDDGRYMVFSTPSFVIGTTNPNGATQVYFCDFGPTGNTPDVTLVSHAAASLTQGSDRGGFTRSGEVSMSGDGELVVFESPSTDLVPALDSHAGSDVYLWRRSTGAMTLLSNPSSSQRYSAYAAISRDGTRAAFAVTDTALPNWRACEMYTVATSVRQTISDPVAGGNISLVALSRDGTRIIFGTGTFDIPQQELWIEGIGIQRLSRSTSGRTTTVITGTPAISGDGRWTSWASPATIFVPNDTNGISDVFIRGPF